MLLELPTCIVIGIADGDTLTAIGVKAGTRQGSSFPYVQLLGLDKAVVSA